MNKQRLEAFSDGVIAILITIMVLELKTPHGAGLEALRPVTPTLLAYVLSFLYMGIYWNSHHHMLHAARSVSGSVLWANLHLLFWLSLVPFTTTWVGENPTAPIPTAIYGVVLLLAGLAYWILQTAIIAHDGPDSLLARAVRGDLKARSSLLAYAAGAVLALFRPWLADTLYILVALMWLVPDRRIERALAEEDGEGR